jgi:hypothetical protein
MLGYKAMVDEELEEGIKRKLSGHPALKFIWPARVRSS